MQHGCPACGGTDTALIEELNVEEWHRRVLDGHDYAAVLAQAQVPESYGIHSCGDCSLQFAVPQVAPDGGWYDGLYRALPLYPASRWEFQKVLSSISAGVRLAELGCGSGAFLGVCRASGVRAVGLDFSRAAVESCRQAGLDAHVLTVADGAQLPVRGFGVVTAFQVLEHVPAPIALFHTAAQLASPEASFWVSVPSHRRVAAMYGEADDLDSPPHHMTRWTGEALRALGNRSGWTLDALHYEDLSLRSALWYATRHSGLYRQLNAGAGPRRFEQAVRYIQYPFLLFSCAWRAQGRGFAMLAHFKRSPG
jgi:2-polyprenyl-3-methyl-5-hydroxy-6-metoxy-1,4-benzoquinol methylase